MFLNHSTSINEVIGKTDNGTLVMLYGHVKERYEERLQRVKELTGLQELDFDYLMKETVRLVNEYYYECRSKNLRKIRNVIRGEVKLSVGKKNLILDLSILVAGSEVTYSDRHPYVIEDQYKELVKSGELMLHDTIIAVETLNTTKKEIYINSEPKPIEVVRSQLLKLNPCHIQYVINCLQQNTKDVKSIKSYILTTLYNAVNTMSIDTTLQVARMLNY